MTPEIVVGPPGTGKTTALIRMVEEALESGIPPQKIGYLSFTRRAAQEAQERAAIKLGLTKEVTPYFRTLHSLCFQTLGISPSGVMEGVRLREFGEWIGLPVTGKRTRDDTTLTGYTQADRALFMENLARVTGISLREMYERDPDDLEWSMVEYVALSLEERKKSHGLLDYTDMLSLFLKTGWSPQLELLLVDEAQDLSQLQWAVVEAIARTSKRIIVAGDDDQAIYRWAGADVNYFVNMKGQVLPLEQSWRVPNSVHNISQSLISRLENRRDKVWMPKRDEGVVDFIVEEEQVDWNRETLVLARNAATLKRTQKFLRAEGVIFEFRGESSIPRQVTRGVKAWERLRKGERVSPEDAAAAMSLIEGADTTQKDVESVGINDLGIERRSVWHEALDGLSEEDRSYMRLALSRGEKIGEKPLVRLSTIHGAKGAESDNVVLYTDLSTRTHREFYTQPDDETRVWYVGVTRARSNLSVVMPKTRRSFRI